MKVFLSGSISHDDNYKKHFKEKSDLFRSTRDDQEVNMNDHPKPKGWFEDTKGMGHHSKVEPECWTEESNELVRSDWESGYISPEESGDYVVMVKGKPPIKCYYNKDENQWYQYHGEELELMEYLFWTTLPKYTHGRVVMGEDGGPIWTRREYTRLKSLTTWRSNLVHPKKFGAYLTRSTKYSKVSVTEYDPIENHWWFPDEEGPPSNSERSFEWLEIPNYNYHEVEEKSLCC